MKTIGRTKDCRGYIVEMTEDEHTSLAALAGVTGGWDYINFGLPPYSNSNYIDTDMSKPINAVRAYTMELAAANRLAMLATTIKKSLKNEH